MHLMESDPALSRPITDDSSAQSGRGRLVVLIDGTHVGAIREAIAVGLIDAVSMKPP